MSSPDNEPVQYTRNQRTGEKTCIDCHKGIAHRLPEMTLAPVRSW